MIKYPTAKNFLVLLLVLGIFPFVSFAQKNGSVIVNDQENEADLIQEVEDALSAPLVELDVSFTGRIGQKATVKAFTSNINEAEVEFFWYLDDIFDQKQSGKAKTEYSFQARRENHVVRLAIMKDQKIIAENSILVSSYNVSLVWQADTYVPPDYKGKALPTRESKVTVSAIPEILKYSPQDLIYTWYIDGDPVARKIPGEDSFSFVITKNTNLIVVTVEVFNPSRSIVVRQSTSIPVVRPSVVTYYQKSEDYSEIATDQIYISPGDDINITAKPFNFQIQKISDLEYKWSFFDQNITGEKANPNKLKLLIKKDSGYGKRNLDLVVSNKLFYKENAFYSMLVNITQ